MAAVSTQVETVTVISTGMLSGKVDFTALQLLRRSKGPNTFQVGVFLLL